MFWMEIFRTGTHQDAQGKTRTWTQQDLDRMVQAYDPQKHEAPIVLGHPQDNHPAYGWIGELKREGEVLLARPRLLSGKLKTWIKKGLYKKRSVSLYPDLTLRHVGFLGASPPAVKGLKDIDLAADFLGRQEEALWIDFMDAPDPTGEEEVLKEKIKELEQMLENARLALEEAKKNEELARLDAQMAAEQSKLLQRLQKKRKFEDFLESQIQKGSFLPAWNQPGLSDFLCNLDELGGQWEFSEGQSMSPLEWFQGFLTSLSNHGLFTQMQAPQGDQERDLDPSERLAQEIADSTKGA